MITRLMNYKACSTNEINLASKICRTKYALYNIILQIIENRSIYFSVRYIDEICNAEFYLEFVLGNIYFHTSNSHIMLQQNGNVLVMTTLGRMGFCVQHKEQYFIYSRCQNIV